MSTASLLTEFLDGWPMQPFDWPTRNCCHFAAAWIRFATGKEIELPATADARSARKALKRLGGSLAEGCRRLHSGLEVPPSLAQTGDLVLVPVDGEGEGVGEALGICSGRDAVLIDSAGKPTILPMDRATNAWRLA